MVNGILMIYPWYNHSVHGDIPNMLYIVGIVRILWEIPSTYPMMSNMMGISWENWG